MADTTIFKYEMDPGSDIRIPAGPNSFVAATAMQMMPVMWVSHEVDEHGKPIYDRVWEVLLAATGVTVPADWRYAGLVQLVTGISVPDPESGEPMLMPKFVVWHAFLRETTLTAEDIPAERSDEQNGYMM